MTDHTKVTLVHYKKRPYTDHAENAMDACSPSTLATLRVQPRPGVCVMCVNIMFKLEGSADLLRDQLQNVPDICP